MFRIIKKYFITGLEFLLTLTGINMLSFISMNNQECKVRPQIVDSNSEESMFFPFSIKTTKCSGSWNSVNNPNGKLCVSNVVKKLMSKRSI